MFTFPANATLRFVGWIKEEHSQRRLIRLDGTCGSTELFQAALTQNTALKKL
jgi:hypothetical protein